MNKLGIIGALTLLATASGAQAATLNTDFYDFEGRAFIENNPPSSTCAAANFSYGDYYTVVFRANSGTNVVSDALAFVTEHSEFRVNASQTPFSLNGSQIPVNWDYFDSRADLVTGTAAVSNMQFTPATITSATKTVIIVGAVSNFFGVSGCTLTFHAALERRPN